MGRKKVTLLPTERRPPGEGEFERAYASRGALSRLEAHEFALLASHIAATDPSRYSDAMLLSLLLLGLPSLTLLASLYLLARRRLRSELPLRLGSAVGVCALAAFPPTLYQALPMGGAKTSALETLGLTLVAWWVLLGGVSVVATFEATAQLVSGHRQMTMIDNWPWFLALVLVQTSLLAAFLAPRFGPGATWKSPRLWLIFAAVAINAACAVDWPWWGS